MGVIRDILRIFPAWVWIAGLAAVVLAGALMWFAYSRDAAHRRAAGAETSRAVAEGQAAATRDAIGVVVGAAQRENDVDEITRENRDAIMGAEGASTPIPPGVGDAGLRALCLRNAYRDDPACQRLRRPDPG